MERRLTADPFLGPNSRVRLSQAEANHPPQSPRVQTEKSASEMPTEASLELARNEALTLEQGALWGRFPCIGRPVRQSNGRWRPGLNRGCDRRAR
jgi:hypothetical protein